MKLTRLCATIATLGPVGYFGASGTVATIITLPLVYLLHALSRNEYYYLIIALLLYMVSVLIVRYALFYMKNHHDPSEIVLDEVVGCIIVFWGIPLAAPTILVGFMLFRFLDIVKLGWIKKAEEWPDGWGVMGDDMVAAVITNVILRILFKNVI
jgi:phosphatidylglycerophosphatase A